MDVVSSLQKKLSILRDGLNVGQELSQTKDENRCQTGVRGPAISKPSLEISPLQAYWGRRFINWVSRRGNVFWFEIDLGSKAGKTSCQG